MAVSTTAATPLHNAAESGDVDKVRELLEHEKYDVNCTDSKGRTPLHYASYKGHLDMVKILISDQFNSDMTIQDVNGATVLMLAALARHDNVVLALLCDYQCPLDVRDRHGRTVLHYACEGGGVSLVQTLIREHKADANARDDSNNTPLNVAAFSGKADVALSLINEFGCNPHVIGRFGRTVLHDACQGGSVNLVQTLIREHKADTNARDDNKDTPLHVAARNKKNTKVELSLISEFGCNPNAKGQFGRTVLHYACQGGSVSLVQTLIREYKADANARDDNNNTPLHVAAFNGKANVALSLITEFSCDPNVQRDYGRTVLHDACQGGSVSLVQTLIRQHKADANVRDDNNNTPLHVAAFNGKANVALSLISEFGCDPNVRGQFSKTVLHCACKGGSVKFVQTLIREHKADTNARDNKNNTPLHVAAFSGKANVTLALISKFGCDHNVKGRFGRTVLHDACQGGSISLVQTLIREHKADVNARDDNKNMPHHVAALNGKADVALFLISEFGCDPNVRGQFNRTVLHHACQGGNVSLVQTLIREHKADANAQDDSNNTPLHVAAFSGKANVALSLISEFDCDPNVQRKYGRTILHDACQGGSVILVQTLIREHKADVNAQVNSYYTPLNIAARNGKADVALLLISEFGCDPNVRGQFGRTLLHHACQGGSVNLVQTLIREHKADANARDDNNKTPLHVAAFSGKSDVALTLISEFGCDPNMQRNYGRTLLHDACQGGSVSLVQTLIKEHKADTNTRDNNSNTPLHVAAFNGKANVALSLVREFGCDPNMQRKYGRTVLHDACQRGSVSLIQTLIREHKADANARDNNNNTPLNVAALHGKADVTLSLISEFGCDPHVRGRFGRTVLHHACQGGSVSLVQTLMTREHKADTNARDNDNNTPLHVAAFSRKADVAVSLISEFGCDPNVRGQFGKTALHFACQGGSIDLVCYLLPVVSLLNTDNHGDTPLHVCSFKGHVECVEALLHSNAPVLIRNNNGKTPLELANGRAKIILDLYMKDNHNKIQIDYNSLLWLAKKMYSSSLSTNRLFVLGNPGAGKSSLVEALKREGFFESFRRISESSVAPHTAGIVPSIHLSKYYGRVWFYDFAGDPEYYSSHAAIFENLASSKIGTNLIIIVVNMTDDDVKRTLHYWFSFIQCQKFRTKFSLFIVGSHSDLLTKNQISKQQQVLQECCASFQTNSAVKNVAPITLDCCQPRSKEMVRFQKQISTWASFSSQHTLSDNAMLLFGLFEKDFSNVTACSIQTILTHIEESGVCLPREAKHLYPSLSELHDVGALLLLGDHNNDDCQVILNSSKLTNEVHHLLFSKTAIDNIKGKSLSSNIGILSDDVLLEILPPYITKQCLIYLQYCHEIKCEDIDTFPFLEQQETLNQSLVFFPAFCNLDKSSVSLNTPCGLTYSIGWLARCTDPFDHFPARFLHVLLLRLVFRFALSAPSQNQATDISHYQRCCTMWKTGVHWLMMEGVECMVEIVDGSKGVVIVTKSKEDMAENCANVFNKIFSCVMEAKDEFCHAIRPDFFLLDSTNESDYLSEDHLFAMNDVEKALAHPERSNWILSVSKKSRMERIKLFLVNKLNFWDVMFPIDLESVLDHLKKIVQEVYYLGLKLKVPYHILEALRVNFPDDDDRRKREVVVEWLKSSPCWWYLVQALKEIGHEAIAEDLKESYCK